MKARYYVLLLTIFWVCQAAADDERKTQSIKGTEIEAKHLEILGKSGIPNGKAFTGKLKIVASSGKESQVKVEIPSPGRTVSFDLDMVRCYALASEDMDVRTYDGKDVVAYEYLAYVGYPQEFWKDNEPLVQPSRRRPAGYYTMLMVRLPEVKPGRVPQLD